MNNKKKNGDPFLKVRQVSLKHDLQPIFFSGKHEVVMKSI